MGRININQTKLAAIEKQKRLEELRETIRDPWDYDALTADEKNQVRTYAQALHEEGPVVPERPPVVASRVPGGSP